MKKRFKTGAYLFSLSVLFLILAVSCKKDDDNTTVTDIDGNVYNTLTIGGKIWMAENLRTTRFRDGSDIPLVSLNILWSGLSGCFFYLIGRREPVGYFYNQFSLF